MCICSSDICDYNVISYCNDYNYNFTFKLNSIKVMIKITRYFKVMIKLPNKIFDHEKVISYNQ